MAKIILALALTLASALPAWADMYQCRDRGGGLRFTNAPASDTCRPVMLLQEQTIFFSHPSKHYSAYSSHSRRFQGPGAHTFDLSISWAASQYGLDPLLIKAMILTESAFNVRAVSQSGAKGLMQLMPDTARELFVRDPFNPHENILGGSRYLRSLLDIFDKNLVLSLAADYEGPYAVLQAGGVPNSPETRRYVLKVLRKYRSLRQAGRGWPTSSPRLFLADMIL
ncbi:MAG: lytic transglycosylase domain-containing protein [Desulfobulbaceae bacterium]|nr:lytic transglycosylase domain-containing protein [Desulfobulbaceae bacterium]